MGVFRKVSSGRWCAASIDKPLKLILIVLYNHLARWHFKVLPERDNTALEGGAVLTPKRKELWHA